MKLLLACPLLLACADDPPVEQDDLDRDSPTDDLVGSGLPDIGKADRHVLDPPDPPDLADPKSTLLARAVLVAAPSGDLCSLDPADGTLLDVEPARAVDVMASAHTPGKAVVSEGSEDGGGAITVLEVSDEGLERGDATALSVDDVRLVHGPSPTLALGIREGTTLFWGDEGRTVFGTTSFWTHPDQNAVDVWLLERADTGPRLLVLRWEGGFREVTQAPVPTPPYGCPPRLVREGPAPLIVGVHDGALVLQQPSGDVVARRQGVADPDACVQDALWLEGSDVAVVLTGPFARLHTLSVNGYDSGETLVFADVIGHDPSPRRRLAFDPGRGRLWAALAGRLEVRERSGEAGLLRVDLPTVCRAESVTLVW
jgi:hypothetical protein